MGLTAMQVGHIQAMVVRFIGDHKVMTVSMALERANNMIADTVSVEEILEILTVMCWPLNVLDREVVKTALDPPQTFLYVAGQHFRNVHSNIGSDKNPSPDFSYGKPDGGESVVRERSVD